MKMANGELQTTNTKWQIANSNNKNKIPNVKQAYRQTGSKKYVTGNLK